jgi:hypothetical protein
MADPTTNDRSVVSILKELIAEDDHNTLTIIAEVINLYDFSIAKTRIGKDRHWDASDVARFLNIALMYLSVGEVEASIAKLAGVPRRPKDVVAQ